MGSKMRKVRVIAAIMAAAIVVGACGAALTTPTATGGATSTPAQSPTQWPTASPSATPTAWPTNSPQSSATPTAAATNAPSGYAIAMGKSALLAPADDNGALAGTEINDFGFDLLRRLDSKGNLCASPASIALALAMVRPGVHGQTASEMDKVLHDFGTPGQAAEVVAMLQSFASQTVYDDSAWYDSNPTADPSATPDHTGLDPIAELDVSNALFSQKGMSLEQAYLNALSSGFGAGVGQLDFASDPQAAINIINKWAIDRTKGRIPEVLQPGDVDSSTRIELANAIYLKAAWTDPFDPAKTKPLPFTTAAGTKVTVPTMATEMLLTYSPGPGYRAVNLGLGDGGLEMTVVVPDDMSSFVQSLSAARLAAMDRAGAEYVVNLTLPRFSAESRVELADVLGAMGMPTAFTTNADLSGITTDQTLMLGTVVHQANIDVVEEGTTAAAVTAVGGRGGVGGAPPPRVTFNVNKPFLYFIRDNASGAILFMGRIDDPSTKS
jgi:serpin B